MRNLRKYPVLVFFFTVIFAIGILNVLTPDKDVSETENRDLQQKPRLSFSSLLDSSERGYAQKYEKYLSDQFVGRDAWITAKSMVEALLGKTENNGIAYGRDDYMFGIYRSIDEKNLQNNINWLKKFAEASPKSEKDLLIVPSSYTVLTDKAPRNLGNIDETAAISEIYVSLVGSYSTINVMSALSKHSDEYIYYRTDHHWTTQGALYAYEEYASAAGFKPVIPDYASGNSRDGFLGTYYNKSKKFDAVSDTLTWYDVPTTSVTIGGEAADGLYDIEKLSTRDQYAMFLHGNNGVTEIVNDAAPEGSILVIKDSYANCFVPFLTQSFRNVTVIDLRYLPTGFSEIIANGGFDRVLVLYNFQNFASDTNIYRLMY